MKAKKLFPDLSFKRLWDKIKDLEDKVGEGNTSGVKLGISEDGKYGFFTLDNKFIPFPNQEQRILTLVSNTSSSIGSFLYSGQTLSDTAYQAFDGNELNYYSINICVMESTIKISSMKKCMEQNWWEMSLSLL